MFFEIIFHNIQFFPETNSLNQLQEIENNYERNNKMVSVMQIPTFNFY